MSMRSAQASVAVPGGDEEPTTTETGAVLSGRVSLLAPSGKSVRVRLDAGAVAGADGLALRPATAVVERGSEDGPRHGWGWRGEAGTVGGTAVEVRRLGVTDGLGAPLEDVSATAVALVVPLLRTGAPVADLPVVAPAGVATALSELVGLVPSADHDTLLHSVDYTDAIYPPDLPSFLDESWGLQRYALDLSLPLFADLAGQDLAGSPSADGLWAGALGYGSVDDTDDGGTGFDWTGRE